MSDASNQRKEVFILIQGSGHSTSWWGSHMGLERLDTAEREGHGVRLAQFGPPAHRMVLSIATVCFPSPVNTGR